MAWGKIYESTWWGSPIINGWGGAYFNLSNGSGGGGVPDDIPHHRDVTDVDHAGDKRKDGAQTGAPPDPQATGLPDHEHERKNKNCYCTKHWANSFLFVD